MKSKSIFSELQVEESTGFLFWQITNLWQKRIRENLLILDLTHVQFVLLASLAWFEETSQRRPKCVLPNTRKRT